MKKVLLLVFIFIGFTQISRSQEGSVVASEQPKCQFVKKKFSKECPKPEKLSCDFDYTKDAQWPYSHLERNMGVCQCMITSSEFFDKHRKLQLDKNNHEKGSKEYNDLNDQIKALCAGGKTYEVQSNGRVYRGIYHYDANFEACRVDYFNAKNGWFDRDRFAFPGAYNGNGALRTYPDEIDNQYMKVKIDESLIDLNTDVSSRMSCAGTYEKIIDRKIKDAGGMEAYREQVKTGRNKNPKEYYMAPVNIEQIKTPSEAIKEQVD